MVTEKTIRNFLPTGIISLVLSSVLIFLFLADVSEFSMPIMMVRTFYLYTILLLVYTIPVIFIIRHFDRKLHPAESGLWNYVRIFLGGLWLLDGILQIQPEMSFGFAPFVLIPTLQALPAGIQSFIHPIIMVWTTSGSLMDAVSGVIQIFLGLSFLTLKSRKYVSVIAAISFLWAISIWIMGEDFGAPGIGMSILTGFPGAALLYAISSLVLVFNFRQITQIRILKYTLALVFIVSAIIQAIPANGYWINSTIASVTGSYTIIYEPRILSLFLYDVAVFLSANIVPWNLILVFVMGSTGAIWLFRPGLASKVTIVVSAVIWIIGQDFGILGGYGTDPNTAFVLLLMSLAMYLHYRKYPEKTLKVHYHEDPAAL